jgi:hypothetical protein
MSKKVGHRKSGKEVKAANSKQTEAAKLRFMDEQRNKRLRAARKMAVGALKTLTALGLLRWRVGDDRGVACTSVRVEFEDGNGINPLFRFANVHDIGKPGETDEVYFDLDIDVYGELIYEVFDSPNTTQVDGNLL